MLYIHIRYGFISSVSIYLLLLIIISIILFIRCYCCCCSQKSHKNNNNKKWQENSKYSSFFYSFLFFIPSLETARQIVVLPGVENFPYVNSNSCVFFYNIWQTIESLKQHISFLMLLFIIAAISILLL